jgi:putative Holliday junction resolvase
MTPALVLAFDFGERRIGVAIGNTLTREARPLSTIAGTGDARWRDVSVLVAQWQPTQLVVGVARYPDGRPNPMTARCEKFARQLAGRYGLPVAHVDERYSSAVVAREEDVDAAAAAVILQQWFAEAGASMLDATPVATATAAPVATTVDPGRACE